MESAYEHESVLLAEALEALQIRENGVYLDGTFGRGGHAGAILDRLGPTGRLLAMDKDPEAIRYGHEQFAHDTRFSIRQGSFAEMGQWVRESGLTGQVDGILLDLGVSSPQLDDAGRGFSFMKEGPLDMRMDPKSGMSASDWLLHGSEQEISEVLRDYGEERFHKRIARAIVTQRMTQPLQTTTELASLIDRAVPHKERHKHAATRSFQAIRIFINRELEDLRTGLQQAVEILAAGGRLVVISFHSLEDRIVKRFMRDESRGQVLPARLPIMGDPEPGVLKLIGKAIRPSQTETDRNPRARSAVLRVAEKRAR